MTQKLESHLDWGCSKGDISIPTLIYTLCSFQVHWRVCFCTYLCPMFISSALEGVFLHLSMLYVHFKCIEECVSRWVIEHTSHDKVWGNSLRWCVSYVAPHREHSMPQYTAIHPRRKGASSDGEMGSTCNSYSVDYGICDKLAQQQDEASPMLGPLFSVERWPTIQWPMPSTELVEKRRFPPRLVTWAVEKCPMRRGYGANWYLERVYGITLCTPTHLFEPSSNLLVSRNNTPWRSERK